MNRRARSSSCGERDARIACSIQSVQIISRTAEAEQKMSAVTPTTTQERWYRRFKNWLWGYDFFISYHWASGGAYAVILAQMLRSRNYDVFLDRADYASGDDWKRIGEVALRNTQRLVVVATRDAVTKSEPVRR